MKPITIVIALIVVGLVVLYMIPTSTQKGNMTIRYFDSQGDIIKTDTVNLNIPQNLQALEVPTYQLPDVPANAVNVEYSIFITNTGNVPIDIAIINAKIAGKYIT